LLLGQEDRKKEDEREKKVRVKAALLSGTHRSKTRYSTRRRKIEEKEKENQREVGGKGSCILYPAIDDRSKEGKGTKRQKKKGGQVEDGR